MSDHEGLPDLSPHEEAEVSRLLADSAEPVRMPADVSSRLDDVLAGLVAQRSLDAEPASEPPGVVVPLRSRLWPKVLVAAAAVSLFGYVGSNLLQQSGGGSSADAGSSYERPSAPEAAAGDGGAREDDAGGGERAPMPSLLPTSDNAAKLFVRDKLLNASEFSAARSYALSVAPPVGDVTRSSGGCLAPASGKGDSVFELALGPKRTVVVVLRPVGNGVARADVYPCQQSVLPVASTLVLGTR